MHGWLGAYKAAIDVMVRELGALPHNRIEAELRADLRANHVAFAATLKPFETKRLHIGVLLYKIVRTLRPRFVVETGVCLGKSTSFILAALRDNRYGHLFSIDIGNSYFEYRSTKGHRQKDSTRGKEIGWLIPNDLRDRWTLCLGSSHDRLLPLLRQLDTIDLFLHDSEHSYTTMMHEYVTAWPYLSEGGFLVSDDVQFTDAFRDFVREMGLVGRVLDGEIGVIQKGLAV